MRIALVHDWLTGMRGGEKVLSLIARRLPQADLFTLIHTPGSCDRFIERRRIVTSFLNRLPAVEKYYRYLLPLMPRAIERLDARDYDLVISFSHCVAKGISSAPQAVHVCYCFTPMRYVWVQQRAYRQGMGLGAWGLGLFSRRLRRWDRASADNVDCFLANSRNVADRIGRCYGRDAAVVHSPIDVDFFTPPPPGQARQDFYLMVTALAPYKRVDQAVTAFARLGRPLRIIGAGPQYARLRRAAPPNVELLGWRDDLEVREHYRRCRALIFPGEEDFGLTPLEAMACGAPVIAFGGGGALETVLDAPRQGPHPPQATPTRLAPGPMGPGRDNAVHGPTGLLYTPQTPEALADAVRRFEALTRPFEVDRLSAWAGQFGPERFYDQFRRAAEPALAAKGLSWPVPLDPWPAAVDPGRVGPPGG